MYQKKHGLLTIFVFVVLISCLGCDRKNSVAGDQEILALNNKLQDLEMKLSNMQNQIDDFSFSVSAIQQELTPLELNDIDQIEMTANDAHEKAEQLESRVSSLEMRFGLLV